MEAKDTLLTDEQVIKLVQIWWKREYGEEIPRENIQLSSTWELLQTQAEISFKAGIKEVVEWLKQYERSSCAGVIIMPVGIWQAKLKEWGIE